MAAAATHRFEEHTGEVRLEVRAPSQKALFEEAGLALAELMLGEIPPSDEGAAELPIEVQAGEVEGLLVDWLNELIFLSETSKRVFTRIRVDDVTATSVRAVAWGTSPEVLKTAVKAATLHGVDVEQSGSQWRASVVLDV